MRDAKEKEGPRATKAAAARPNQQRGGGRSVTQRHAIGTAALGTQRIGGIMPRNAIRKRLPGTMAGVPGSKVTGETSKSAQPPNPTLRARVAGISHCVQPSVRDAAHDDASDKAT